MSGRDSTSIPYGYCQCGCGELAPVSAITDRTYGWVKDQPKRFIRGHAARRYHLFVDTHTVDVETGCWNWNRSVDRDGYGLLPQLVSVKGTRRAHRAYYEHFIAPMKSHQQIDHLCRNRACVNPEHLEPVTTAENIQRGSSAVLTPEGVKRIRAMRREGATYTAIGKALGVSPGTAHNVANYHTWRNVP